MVECRIDRSLSRYSTDVSDRQKSVSTEMAFSVGIPLTERRAALAVARQAAEQVAVPFLVVDMAQTVDGRWIVIECNDGQESGYAGIPPNVLWRNILKIEGNA